MNSRNKNLKASKRERFRRQGIYVLPNLVTTMALFCGFLSIIFAIDGKFLHSAWMVLIAGVFDGLDGKVARLTHTHSDFGIQYDSLSDVVSFGLAPAVLAYTFALKTYGKFGWAAAFLFFVCGALRLARFNVQASTESSKHFQGLPIPMAAYSIASYVVFLFRDSNVVTGSQPLILAFCVVMALMMVSPIRYRSLKVITLNRQGFFILVGIAIAIFIVASLPDIMIFTFTIVYILTGPVEAFVRLLLNKPVNPEQLSLNLESLSHPEGSSLEAEPLRVIQGKD
ncbi:MAG: CDP-diacylglycerol--serine O-phosphatidyltransferase [Deltaproteobacteria bacterium]|nr:CDP-diacylglycerol--serine O-phosphatidyltransferase [Deltaproteobacteria bacterium]